MSLSLHPIHGIGVVTAGQDLARILEGALRESATPPQSGDVLVVSQKIVSKAEGRVVDLCDVKPRLRARRFAERHGKDARMVELALREATDVLRMSAGHLIAATGPGFVCANAGIDRSNQSRDGEVTLLPIDADASARVLRKHLAEAFGIEVAVIISDTFGRPWRLGQLDFAIGAAGIAVLDDHAGRRDWSGRPLEHTVIAVADQLAAAAGLLMGKDDGVPAVLVRGYAHRVSEDTAAALVRPRKDDLFR